MWRQESGVWRLESGVWSLESGVCRLQCGHWSLQCGDWSLESGVWSLENQLNQLLIYVFIYDLNVFFYFSILHDLHLYNKKSTYCKLVMGHYNSIFMPGAHLERWHTKKAQPEMHKKYFFLSCIFCIAAAAVFYSFSKYCRQQRLRGQYRMDF